MHTGIHLLYFNLNGNHSAEPRVGLKWRVTPGHVLSAGAGIHSRLETVTNYLAEHRQEDGSTIRPNRNLEISKARHYVIGYQNHSVKDLMIKGELYYQDLYDVPIPGLYAVGLDAGGLHAESYSMENSSGAASAFALISGRIAGENAVRYLRMQGR